MSNRLQDEMAKANGEIVAQMFRTVFQNGGSSSDLFMFLQCTISAALLVLDADPSEAMPILSKGVVSHVAFAREKMKEKAN